MRGQRVYWLIAAVSAATKRCLNLMEGVRIENDKIYIEKTVLTKDKLFHFDIIGDISACVE